MNGQPFTLAFPPELVDAIADAVAAKLASTGLTSSTASPYLSVAEAAEFLRAGSKQRIPLARAERLAARLRELGVDPDAL